MEYDQLTTWTEEFEQMSDPRGDKGKRYPWWVLMTLIAAALVSGQLTMSAVSQWVQEHAEELRQRVWPRLPSAATLRRALQQMPLEQLERIMYQEVSQTTTLQARALDGKTVRGASLHGEKIHMVREVLHGSGEVLQQHTVNAKTNEIPIVRQMLSGRNLHGLVFTMDALHTQRETMDLIHQQGGYSLQIVKENQPSLLQSLKDWFADDPWPEEHRQRWREQGKGHGRRETREIERIVCPERLRAFWPHVLQVFRRTCHSVEITTGKLRFEVSYALSDPSAVETHCGLLARPLDHRKSGPLCS
jgi:hypothetical protein